MTTVATKFNPKEMYKESKEWLSLLSFTKDEHHFFIDITKEITLQITGDDSQIEKEEMIDAINRSERRNSLIIDMINTHLGFLNTCIKEDTINERESFVREHKSLIETVSHYIKGFKRLKKQLFGIIKSAKKDEKLEYLLDEKIRLEPLI